MSGNPIIQDTSNRSTLFVQVFQWGFLSIMQNIDLSHWVWAWNQSNQLLGGPYKQCDISCGHFDQISTLIRNKLTIKHLILLYWPQRRKRITYSECTLWAFWLIKPNMSRSPTFLLQISADHCKIPLVICSTHLPVITVQSMSSGYCSTKWST